MSGLAQLCTCSHDKSLARWPHRIAPNHKTAGLDISKSIQTELPLPSIIPRYNFDYVATLLATIPHNHNDGLRRIRLQRLHQHLLQNPESYHPTSGNGKQAHCRYIHVSASPIHPSAAPYATSKQHIAPQALQGPQWQSNVTIVKVRSRPIPLLRDSMEWRSHLERLKKLELRLQTALTSSVVVLLRVICV